MCSPSYLSPLNQYIDFIQLKQCAEVAKIAFRLDIVNKDLIEELRGNLLRTLSEISQLLNNRQGLYVLMSNYVCSFFNFNQGKGDLKESSTQELQNIKHVVIVALQGLANNFPIIDVDPIDLNPIKDDEVNFTSLMGRKYRLVNIVEWIKVCRKFIYPDSNLPMLAEDIEQLKRLCVQQNLSMEPEPSPPVDIVDPEQELLNAGFSMNNIAELNSPHLRINHVIALKKLLTEFQLSHSQAIAELEGLNYEQADALSALYSLGLRGEHLRHLSIDQTEFGPHHRVVLKKLINELHYEVNDAVLCISGCDFDEVQKFYSMSSTDVDNLLNRWNAPRF